MELYSQTTQVLPPHSSRVYWSILSLGYSLSRASVLPVSMWVFSVFSGSGFITAMFPTTTTRAELTLEHRNHQNGLEWVTGHHYGPLDCDINPY